MLEENTSELNESLDSNEGIGEKDNSLNKFNKIIKNIICDQFDYINNQMLNNEVYLGTLLYMVYWFNRSKNDDTRQQMMKNNLLSYLDRDDEKTQVIVDKILSDNSIQEIAKDSIENNILTKPTVDLVISRDNKDGDKEILIGNREVFPEGNALFGGFIWNEDEENELGVENTVFSALRVAGEKIIESEELTYGEEEDDNNIKYYFVSGNGIKIKLFHNDVKGYKYKDRLSSILEPSDPRHIVDTTGFSMEIDGDINGKDFSWKLKSEIMDMENDKGGLAFKHHREIVAELSSKDDVVKSREGQERETIRNIINHPTEVHNYFQERLDAVKNPLAVSFSEFQPVVEKLQTAIFSDEINKICSEQPSLMGVRDQVFNSLNHCLMKGGVICPYGATFDAIFKAIGFIDTIARTKVGFYDNCDSNKPIVHDPRIRKFSSFHMKKYEFHLDQLKSKFPDEILIPTFEHIGATDLMKIRGVPIRLVGLSLDFLYVDEFMQSPQEFFMHDIDHSIRMVFEDEKYMDKTGKNKEEMMEESMQFSGEYLERIKILPTDTEEEKEMKKLKKIILFEIVHEDSKPFLRDVICDAIQSKEGNDLHYEMISSDPETGKMNLVKTVNQSISPLSYVRHKLQHGFFDRVDNHIPQIVSSKYRTADWIAKAAHDMLNELGAIPNPGSDLDANGKVSYDWLLKRTVSISPNKIHNKDFVDPSTETHGDGTGEVSNKRY